MPLPRALRLLLPVAVAAALLWGWGELWFLTDDAYIAFRYVRNGRLGWGWTWNPPPFLPVEGYTSFLWVALLDLAWRLGVEPPMAANLLSLACGGGSAWLGWRLWQRVRLPEPAAARHGVLGVLVLLGICTSRVFLTWLSSGLETGLFNVLVLAWLFVALTRPGERGAAWGPLLGLLTALLTLTRPDGLLYTAATVALLALHLRRDPRVALGLVPLLLVAAQLLWRRATYGAWLPNTYYAKVTAPWPEAGWRYLASYVVENGAWLWLLLAAAFLVLRGLPALRQRVGVDPLDLLAWVLPAGTLAAHVGWYVLRVGGDHFEYRVLSHLVVPLLVSGAWLSARLAPVRGPVLMLGLVLSSWPLPWLHHALGRDLVGREATSRLTIPLAPHVPVLFQPVVAAFDGWQAWLIEHYVCLRHREHQQFLLSLVDELPSVEAGSALSWEADRPIGAVDSVGLAGWVLPQVAIIDKLGLNDPVVARGPLRVEVEGGARLMAHERVPPAGYLACFRNNVVVRPDGAWVDRNVPPMSDAEIQACQARFLP